MLINYPRTEVITLDSIALYQKGLHRKGLSPKNAAIVAHEHLASLTITALDTVRTAPPILSAEQKKAAYENVRLIAGGGFESLLNDKKIASIVSSKLERGL